MKNITWGSLGKESDNGERTFFWRKVETKLPNEEYDNQPLLLSAMSSNGEFSTHFGSFNSKDKVFIYQSVYGKVVAWAPLPIPLKINK